MNRKQAGAFAVGVLVVAMAIIVFGGVFNRPGSPAATETASTAASGSATANSPSPAKPAGKGENAAKPQPAGGEQEASTGLSGSEGAAEGKAAAAVKTAPANSADATLASNTPKPGPIAPSFDLLRVEPDGSTVIAGRAQPGSKVEIMDKGKSLLTTKADNTGSFVGVFDKPLAPGNYELTLKSTGNSSASETSSEVATVSVPKRGNQAGLLAMISKPGEASRIITAPQPRTPAAATGGNAPTQAGASTNEVASAGQPLPGGAASPQPRAPIHVDAVEIEGDRVYVAGSAPHSSTVRVYADDKYVGEDRATAENRFVVNGKMALAPGTHTIRADLIDPGSGKVRMRASVPFDRPSGKDFAAVAPQVAEQQASGASVPAGGVAVQPSSAAARASSSGSNGGTQAGPATVVQPALTNSDSFVIIRRGDTLWQISRRVYGLGIRYTTIYLANAQEIGNPNLILPGQVFDVPEKPEKTLDQAEKLHRELMKKEGRL